MKKMYKSRNEENLLPFHIIKAASEGDVSAINAVLKHYEGLFYNGEYLTNEQMNDKRFIKLLDGMEK